MPLVQVHGRRGLPQRAQGLHPSDSEHDLLTEPLLDVRGVQIVGYRPIPRPVLRKIGGEEVEGDPPDHRPPYPNVDWGIEEGNGDEERVPLPVGGATERVGGGVEGLADLLLPPIVAEPLADVAVGVDEPHPDQREPEIARLLEGIPGEDPQPACVDGEGNVNPELRGEVGH